MIPLDTLAPNFLRARLRWPSAETLQSHYQDVAATYAGNQHSLIELTKSFVESVCVTILREHGTSVPSDAKTTWLLTAALAKLGLENTRGASQFDKVLSAYNKLADALNDARNQVGPAAHGKDGFLDSLAENHTRVYLLSADAILSLLLNALEGKEPNLQHTREPYSAFKHHNRRIDACVYCAAEVDDEGDVVVTFATEGLEGVELRVRPSEFLFAHDRDAYIEFLNAVPRGVAPAAGTAPGQGERDGEPLAEDEVDVGEMGTEPRPAAEDGR